MKWTRIKNPVWKQRLVAKYDALPLIVKARFKIYIFGWIFLLLASVSLTAFIALPIIWYPITILTFLGFAATSVSCFYKSLSDVY